jgi:DNA repair protein RadC
MLPSRIVDEGAESASDLELVAALLAGAGRKQRAELLAARVLEPGLSRLRRITAGELLAFDGLRESQARRLLAGLELGRRVAAVQPVSRDRLLQPDHLAALVWPRLAPLAHEEFWAVLLTARLEEVRSVRIARGGLTQCSVLPREAFAPALVHAAPCVAFAHNHPSGDPEPSSEDRRLELLLDEAGRTLGIRVVDHIVVGEAGFHSARQGAGRPPPPRSLVA